MKKHIILILLSAVAILALMFFLWFWLLRAPAPAGDNTGTLGEGGTRTPITGTGGTDVNNQIPINNQTGTAGQVTSGGSTNVQTPATPNYGSTVNSPNTPITYNPYTPGGVWLDGSSNSTTSSSAGGIGGTGSPRGFTPTPINQISSVDIGGTGYFPNTPNGSAGSGNGGIGGGLGIGIAVVGCTASLLGGVTGAGTTAGADAAAAGLSAGAIPTDDRGSHAILTASFSVSNSIASSQAYKETFLDCIARTIARAAIDRITADVVDWINSGFDGKPAFVQDFKQFFSDVGDQAAGEFIQGSKLAFLCSPFQLQVKIAVAQSYAHRSGSGGGESNACTLSDVSNNIQSFIEGNFSEGGWPAFLEFTTVPTNNPFGAFMTVDAQLGNKVASVQANAQLDLTLGRGFLSSTEEYDCGPVDPTTHQSNPPCKTRVTTPGSAIEAQLEKTLGTSIDSLELADNFDEIISALVSQLMTRTLYGGLSKLSGSQGYASNFSSAQDPQAQAAAEALLTNLQGTVQYAQQYGVSKQGSIGDIQNAQNLLQSLANCWSVTASSTGLTTQQQDQALSNVNMANSSIQALEARVAALNADITRANTAIAKVQQFQTSALAATTKAAVDAVANDFDAARNSGALMTQADVTAAQQDRTTLQGEMATLNQTTNSQVTQCYAFGQ